MPELSPGPGLVLVGLPGSGKSTVGRLVAERLGRPFVDTDESIAARVGVPAAAYLRDRGEPAFRAVEREALREACADPLAVVAPGAGALSDPLDRWRLWDHGLVVWLRVPEETLLVRLAADRVPRPLLDGSPGERLAALAEARAPFYRAADVTVDAAGSPDRVAESVVRSVTGLAAERGTTSTSASPPGRRLFDAEEPRHHPIGPERARVLFGHGLGRGAILAVVHDLAGTARLVGDARAVAALHGRLPSPTARHLVRGGERIKRLSTLARVLAWLAADGAERGDPIVAVGGGTVLDLAGLAAALHARGAPWVAVPTTWLAQADAALGGKVAVDLPEAKNGAGAFWPPWAILADTAVLGTLPLARRRDGLVEALKAALIGDPALWELIAERGRAALGGAARRGGAVVIDTARTDEPARYAITERAVRVKLAIVRRDPFEQTGERRLLNLGHTLGHALEVASGYRLPHGTAVSLGLRAAASIAAGRGADPALPGALDEVLRGLRLPLCLPFDRETVRAALTTDKKREGGRLRWLLPMGIGQVVEVDDVTERELARAIETVHGDG